MEPQKWVLFDIGGVLEVVDDAVCVDGARAVGMRAIEHRDNDSTIEAIERFLRRDIRQGP